MNQQEGAQTTDGASEAEIKEAEEAVGKHFEQLIAEEAVG